MPVQDHIYINRTSRIDEVLNKFNYEWMNWFYSRSIKTVWFFIYNRTFFFSWAAIRLEPELFQTDRQKLPNSWLIIDLSAKKM